MKRILMFIDTIGRNGGAERQFSGLACMLADSGYDVSVVAYYPERGFFDELTSHGINVKICDFGNSRISKIYNAYRVFKTIKPDVVISYKNGPNFIACVLRLLGLRFKLIVSDRNTLQEKNKSMNLQYKLYRKANYIVPNSKSQARFIEKHYPKLKDKIKVITNFTNTDVFHPLVSKPNKETCEIVVCGRITEQKNVLNFLQATALLKSRANKPFSIKWYGAIKNADYYTKCENLIKRLEIGDVFSFQKPRIDIDAVYRNADIFVLPSIYEGFPNVLCEAMASGLPVAASKVCDNPDIVTDESNGVLFNPLDTEDIAAKIAKIISLPNSRLTDMGRLGRDAVVQLCGRESFLSSYIKLL